MRADSQMYPQKQQLYFLYSIDFEFIHSSVRFYESCNIVWWGDLSTFHEHTHTRPSLRKGTRLTFDCVNMPLPNWQYQMHWNVLVSIKTNLGFSQKQCHTLTITHVILQTQIVWLGVFHSPAYLHTTHTHKRKENNFMITTWETFGILICIELDRICEIDGISLKSNRSQIKFKDRCIWRALDAILYTI